jgi:two-component system cell cycle response regulator
MSARVLVVDDISANVRLLQAKLESEYFSVVTASSGFEALEVVASAKPDIVLLDVMMPGMDGFEVCIRMKADAATAHIPVILVTALSEQEFRLQGLAAGADDFLTKPVDNLALFARVRSLVRVKQMTDELRSREQTSRELGALDAEATPVDTSGARVIVVAENVESFAGLAKCLEPDITAQFVPAAAGIADAVGGDCDAIVIDADVTGYDGLRLCAELRGNEVTRQAPILLLIETEDRDRLVKALDIGVTDYALKPIDPPEFMARTRAQIKRKRYQDRLRDSYHRRVEMAVTDELTGLFNRHYLKNHVKEAMRRGSDGHGCAVMILDIDYFKKVNDTHGHAAGDEVLQTFAKRLARGVRGVDLACRLGGEEFVVLMPDTDLAAAEHVAGRLKESIAATPFSIKTLEVPIHVTCSIGVTVERAGDTFESMLERADQGLYEAKESGRNRVVALQAPLQTSGSAPRTVAAQ